MIYENVSRLCYDHRIPISTLEREVGIGNGTIGKWRGMKGSPRVETVKKIADYFGVPMDDLLRYEEGGVNLNDG